MTHRAVSVAVMVCVILLASAIAPGAASSAPIKWEPLGLTGNGGMFAPAISPADPKLMMLNCDMSGAYISRDGGQSWRMIDCTQLRSSTRCRPAMHPTNPKVIFAAQAYHGMKVTRDGGEHWDDIKGTPEDLCGEIAIDRGLSDRMLAGDDRGVIMSTDGGKTWRRCKGPRGQTVAFHFDQTSLADKRVCFAATSEGIWRSDNDGATWAEKDVGLPWKGIRSFCGGSRAKDKLTVLYCAVPSKSEGGKYVGGVFRSTDRGETWQSVMGGGINTDTKAADQWAENPVCQYHWVLTTDANPDIVYALNANTGVRPPHHTAVYRSDDAGKTWRPTFYPDPRFDICNAEPDFVVAGDGQFYQETAFGAAIDDANPEHLMWVADMVYYTENGGKDWKCGHERRVPGSEKEKEARWLCNGLVVTTTWNYYIDPFDPLRHYICYTDIGFARSLDGAKSWTWWGSKKRSPWRNTCYELAFDPQTAGKVWGAFSEVHDIPNSNIIDNRHNSRGKGGICVSADHGDSWTPGSQGLPESPALSIVLDPKSPAGNRTLYASMFNNGVYKSTDDGKSWAKASQGLGSPADMRTCRIQLHADGTLFVLVTAMKGKNGQFVKEGPGLYRSRDGAKNWELVKAFLWPKDFTVDPADSKVIYVGAADAKDDQAGLWRTTDGGATWTRLAKEGPEHFGADPHPHRKGWIYMTLTEDAPGPGLWLSKDDGKTFKPMSLPFANAQRVTFDPANDDVIYVTTFGGSVWRGPAAE